MMEIGDVVRDIFRALGIPEWEVIGMPVPFDDQGPKPPSRTGEVQGGTPAPEPAAEPTDAGDAAQIRVKPRRRKVRSGTG